MKLKMGQIQFADSFKQQSKDIGQDGSVRIVERKNGQNDQDQGKG